MISKGGTDHGFTLLETLIAMGVFSIIAISLFLAYSNVLDILLAGQSDSTALAILNNEIEIIRNVPYPDVGISGGSPPGKLLATKVVTLDNVDYTVTTTIHNIDDVFDGTVTSVPPDTIPADYKLVQVQVTCAECKAFIPASITTTVAPRSLESATRNGSLFLNVIDASGNPISGATVHITNTTISPAINITDTTNVSGSLDFVDIATSTAGFHIVVSKNGYSSDQTYPLGDVNNPNPIHPDLTVKEQTVTNDTFVIDQLGSFTLKTTDKFCAAVPNVSFEQVGSKMIGYNPDVPKYDVIHATDSTGTYANSSVEWDTYDLNGTDATYDIAGTVPYLPLVVDPASSALETFVMEPKNPSSLLVRIVDDNNAPLADATVEIQGNGIDITKLTGRNTIDQTDWSASGAYTSITSHLNVSTSGQVTLTQQPNGHYASNSDETLISKTFDLGTSTTTLYALNWTGNQPANTVIKFQLAANNDNATWNYQGPDGKSSSYFTTSGTATDSSLNNKRYVRYKVILRTSDQSITPELDTVSIDFRSSCTAEGQAFFTGLPTGTYTINLSKTGYDPVTDTVDVLDPWQVYDNSLLLL